MFVYAADLGQLHCKFATDCWARCCAVERLVVQAMFNVVVLEWGALFVTSANAKYSEQPRPFHYSAPVPGTHVCLHLVGIPKNMTLTGSPCMPEDFPNEILLQILSFLPLKSLITGRTVSQEWRRLIPLADINPIRRSFLDFYLTLVNSPIFPQTRPWVLANLQPFDRQQYINDLLDQHIRKTSTSTLGNFRNFAKL